jgi:diguanylate cyclase
MNRDQPVTDKTDVPLLVPETPERCAEYLRLSLAQMREAKASAHPVNYSLFFHHAAGTSASLSDKLEAARLVGGDWDDGNARALFLRYLLPCNDSEASGLQQELSEAVDSVVNATTSLGYSARQHAASLHEKETQLASCKSTEQAKSIAKGLLREAHELYEFSAAKALELQESAAQIKKLRDELQRARREAMTDTLTGLSNRKVFDQTLSQLVRLRQEEHIDFSLIIMDIDHFKKINDRYGHLIGDRVLQQLAHQTMRKIRRTDVAARYGGEEFGILLPRTCLDQARQIAETIRLSIGHINMRRTDTGEVIGNITASFGVAQYHPSESKTDLIGRADRAMYAAKQKGRNRTVTSSAQAPPIKTALEN